MNDRDEKKLINELHNMPNVVDHLHKEELYKQILVRLSEDHSPKHRRKLFIPIAAAAVLFLLISLPFLINIRSDQATGSSNASDFQESTLIREESSADSEADYAEENEESLDDTEIMTGKNEAAVDMTESRVLAAAPAASQVKHFVIHDKQLQFVIPITLITAADEETAVINNKMNHILASNHFSTDAAVKETAFTQEASYMIYENQYFVPILQDETASISEAINTLKTAIPESDIEGTIPSEIDFRIDANHQDELILEYRGNGNLEENDFTVTMVESILLTAKSYGYQAVLFQNMPFDKTGMYQLSKAIDVPIGVNPVYLQN